MNRPHAFCPACGGPLDRAAPWPQACGACGRVRYLNPLPVAVLLVPVDDGLMVIRRAEAPQVGELALPGGFIEVGETWQEAGARELYEEAGVHVDVASIQDFVTLTDPAGYLLVFGLTPRLIGADLPPFTPNSEVSERGVIDAPRELAFPLHTEAQRRWFAGRGGR